MPRYREDDSESEGHLSDTPPPSPPSKKKKKASGSKKKTPPRKKKTPPRKKKTLPSTKTTSPGEDSSHSEAEGDATPPQPSKTKKVLESKNKTTPRKKKTGRFPPQSTRALRRGGSKWRASHGASRLTKAEEGDDDSDYRPSASPPDSDESGSSDEAPEEEHKEMEAKKDLLKKVEDDDTSGISESSDTSGGDGQVKTQTQYEYNRPQVAEGFCHVDGCLMAGRHPKGRNSAFNHNCDGCGRTVHPYCVEKILDMKQKDLDATKYCTDCFRKKNPTKNVRGGEGDGEAKNAPGKDNDKEENEGTDNVGAKTQMKLPSVPSTSQNEEVPKTQMKLPSVPSSSQDEVVPTPGGRQGSQGGRQGSKSDSGIRKDRRRSTDAESPCATSPIRALPRR